MNYDRERNRYTERPSDADVFSVDAGHIEEIGTLLLGGSPYAWWRGLPHGEEVCSRLRLSTRTLQDYRDSGTIAYCKIGSKILYRQSDIQAMLERHYYPISKKP